MLHFGLKQRMLIMLGAAILLVLCILSTYIALTNRSQAIHSARELAISKVERSAALMEQEIDYAFSTIKTLSYELQAYDELPLHLRRHIIDTILVSLYEKNTTKLVDIWTAWEPNALDGKDAEFVNKTPGHDATGRYVPAVSRGGLEPVIGYNIPGKDIWYTTPLKEQKDFASEPYNFTYANDNRTIKLLTLSVPIIKNNTSIAVVGTDLDINHLIAMVEELDTDEFEGVLLTNKGTYLVADDKNNVGKIIDVVSPELKPLFDEAAKGKTVTQELTVTKTQEKSYLVYTPIRIGETEKPWVLGVNIPMSVVLKEANNIVITICISGFVALLLLMGLVWMVAKSIVDPLQKVIVSANEIAAGNLGVVIQETGRHDELNTLATALRGMVANLKQKIQDSEEKSFLANEESKRAHEATSQANRERESTEKSKEKILNTAKTLKNFAGVVNDAVDSLSRSIIRSENEVAVQSSRLNEAAVAVHHVYNTAQTVAKSALDSSETSGRAKEAAQEGAVIVEQATKATKEAQEVVLLLKEKMNDLNTLAGSINNIISVISDIADQTNLLALNAAIEAARAGEAGRGFAVVADEVRKLAEKTMLSTQEVTRTIASITKGILDGVKTVDEATFHMAQTSEQAAASGQALASIVKEVDRATEQMSAIVVAAEEQLRSCESMTKAIADISDSAQGTAQEMQRSSNAVGELARQNAQLQSVADGLVDMDQN